LKLNCPVEHHAIWQSRPRSYLHLCGYEGSKAQALTTATTLSSALGRAASAKQAVFTNYYDREYGY
jgi:hypothetical protein